MESVSSIERDVLEHVTGVKRFDRVLTELSEIQAIADVIDFWTGKEVERLPAGMARPRSDQLFQLNAR